MQELIGMKKQKTKRDKEWACYKGDEFITIGTISEISDYLGISEASVTWMTSPSARARYDGRGTALYEIPDDEEE
jgi:hypothetical protein